MTHWNMANTRRSDREAKIRFPDEYNQLCTDETGKYYVRGDNGIPMSSQQEPNVIPSISNSHSPSISNSHSPSINQAEAKAAAAASASASAETRAHTREVVNTIGLIAGFLYVHGIKLSTQDVDMMLQNGFDIDAIFWIMEKTEAAHPAYPTSYFRSVQEDKLKKKTTTIKAIKEDECDSPASSEMFEEHVKYWQKEFTKFRQR